MEKSTDEALSLHHFSQSDGISQTPPSKVTLQCQGLSVTLTTAIGGLILKSSVVFDSMNLESGDWMEHKRSTDSKAAGTHKHTLGFLNFGNSFFGNCEGRAQEKRKGEESKSKDERKSQDGLEEMRVNEWKEGPQE